MPQKSQTTTLNKHLGRGEIVHSIGQSFEMAAEAIPEGQMAYKGKEGEEAQGRVCRLHSRPGTLRPPRLRLYPHGRSNPRRPKPLGARRGPKATQDPPRGKGRSS